MFEELERINQRPKPYEHYTAPLLWTDPHVSQQMLAMHLDETEELASRPKSFIDRSVVWISSRFQLGRTSRICDFGCGPGLYTTPFAEMGADVTGVDFSERSIPCVEETARSRGLSIDLSQPGLLEFDTLERLDLITMIYCDFCVLSPEQRSLPLETFPPLPACGRSRPGQLRFDGSLRRDRREADVQIFARRRPCGNQPDVHRDGRGAPTRSIFWLCSTDNSGA